MQTFCELLSFWQFYEFIKNIVFVLRTDISVAKFDKTIVNDHLENCEIFTFDK